MFNLSEKIMVKQIIKFFQCTISKTHSSSFLYHRTIHKESLVYKNYGYQNASNLIKNKLEHLNFLQQLSQNKLLFF